MAKTVEPRKALLDTLYRSYRGVVEARCQRVLKDRAAAEDATQEVFVRVSKHLGSMPPGAPETVGWLLRIATNHCFNVRRNSVRRAQALDTWVSAAPATHPEERMAQREEAVQVLAEAPEKLRRPAFLYFCEGFEQQEIAGQLSISRRTVINRLSSFVDRARSRTRRAAGTRIRLGRGAATPGLRERL